MWFNIGLWLPGWSRKMHLCVDYFVTDSPVHSPGNVWRRSDFSPNFWLSLKERRMLRKRDYQGRLSFQFFDRLMTDLASHRQKKKSKQCPEKKCRCSNSAFWMELNEIDQLCTEPACIIATLAPNTVWTSPLELCSYAIHINASFNPFRPNVLFMGHRRTVHDQIRRR